MDPNVVLLVGVCFNSHAVKRFKAGLSTSLSIVQGVNHEYLYYKFLVFWERIKALLVVPFATKFFGRLLLPRFSRQKLGIYTQKTFYLGSIASFLLKWLEQSISFEKVRQSKDIPRQF